MIEAKFVFLLSLPVYIILLIFWLKQKKKLRLLLFFTLFYFYIVAVIGVTLFPLPIQKTLIESHRGMLSVENNFIPFLFLSDTITGLSYHPNIPSSYFDYALFIAIRQVGGNILLGAPFGFLLPLVWKKRHSFWKVLLAGFCFSFAIEASQFLISLFLGYTYRITDIDDIILNCTGVALGYACFRIFLPLLRVLKLAEEKPPKTLIDI